MTRQELDVSAGDLRYRVSIQRPKPSAVEDGSGHVDLTNDANWVEVCQRYADPQSLGGSEVVINDKIVAVNRWEVTMRYDRLTSELAAPWRICHNAHKLNIQSVSDPNGLKRKLIVQCIERS